MDKSKEKKINTLEEQLLSTNDAIVLGAVKQLRACGNEKIIPGLVNVMVTTKDKNVYSEISQLLYDLKNKKTIQPLIGAIKQPNTKGHRNILIAAFWEAGLDASEHLGFFVDMALEEDYLTCLECLTVIENMEGPFKDDEIIESNKKINETLKYKRSDKDDLLASIINVLNNKLIG